MRNAFHRRTYKERAQPSSRKKFGLLEKHIDYVERAKAYHKKQDALQRLREKAANRNEDEFYFKMVRTRMVDGVHMPESEANKFNHMHLKGSSKLKKKKTHDIDKDLGCFLLKVQAEKKKIEKLTAALHSFGSQPSKKRIFVAEDRNVSYFMHRETNRSYKELKESRNRLNQLEKNYNDMAMQKELQGKKHKLREDEIVCPTTKPIYKWRAERKR